MAAPFDDRQRWWWRFAAPPLIVFFAVLWSLSLLGRIEQRTGAPLYALFAQSDGQTYWKPGGEAQAYATITRPYIAGLSLTLLATALGSVGIRRGAGWWAVAGFWAYGLFCAIILSIVFGGLSIVALGVFI